MGVRVFITICDLVPKIMKNTNDFRLVKSVIVRGKEVGCSGNHINTILRRNLGDAHVYEGFPIT